MNDRYRQAVTARILRRRPMIGVATVLFAAGAMVSISAMSNGDPPTTTAAVIPAPEPVVTPTEPPRLQTTKSGDGFLVIKSSDSTKQEQPPSKKSGQVVSYSVEFERGLRSYARKLSSVADDALQDPKRGWGADGKWTLRRVSRSDKAQVRVVLATPETVDARCAAAGFNTAGIFSCWDWERAMINLYRWNNGASDFNSLATYRRYVINHEIGHGLGLVHVFCPAAGAPAPVMMQQTKSTGSCKPNAWPNP